MKALCIAKIPKTFTVLPAILWNMWNRPFRKYRGACVKLGIRCIVVLLVSKFDPYLSHNAPHSTVCACALVFAIRCMGKTLRFFQLILQKFFSAPSLGINHSLWLAESQIFMQNWTHFKDQQHKRLVFVMSPKTEFLVLILFSTREDRWLVSHRAQAGSERHCSQRDYQAILPKLGRSKGNMSTRMDLLCFHTFVLNRKIYILTKQMKQADVVIRQEASLPNTSFLISSFEWNYIKINTNKFDRIKWLIDWLIDWNNNIRPNIMKSNIASCYNILVV